MSNLPAERGLADLSRAAQDVLAAHERLVSEPAQLTGSEEGFRHLELAHAAACYAYPELTALVGVKTWPWPEQSFQVSDHRCNYVRAAALLLAAAEQLDGRAGAVERGSAPGVKPLDAAVPKPTLRNPFKAGSVMAKQFDGMLQAYAEGHRDIVREGGKVRCMGNSMATSFWRGYDSTPPHIVPKGTPAWACYRAGQAQRLLDDARGVYVPPKSNSLVKPQKWWTEGADAGGARGD